MNRSLSRKDSGVVRHLVLAPVTSAEAAKVLAATKIAIAGYRRVLGSSEIRHTVKKHGDAQVEARRNPPQLPIAPRDFGQIGKIVQSGSVVGVRSVGRGASKITWKARLRNVEYTYVEEVQRSAGRVALKTLWKRRI